MSEFTITQMKTIKCILGIVETGKIGGDPSTLTVLEDGAGITYGKHQCTENSGSLAKLLWDFYEPREAAKFKNELAEYKELLYPKASKSNLSEDDNFKSLLRRAAKEDSEMLIAQNNMFHKEYFLPALGIAQDFSVKTALGLLVIYDICIHSGTKYGRNLIAKFDEDWEEPEELASESQLSGDQVLELNKSWTKALINYRHDWLTGFISKSSGHQKVVRNSAYRTASYQLLAENNNWDLELPMTFVLNKKAVGFKNNQSFYITEDMLEGV